MSALDLHKPWRDEERERTAYTFGMWLFLASEGLLFGALFFVYATMRALHPAATEMAAHETDLIAGAANTAVLLASSCAIACAERLAEADRWRVARVAVFFAASLGVLFLAIKAAEYREDISKHLVPGPAFPLPSAQSQWFWAFYWFATGVHAIHVLIGLTAFARLLAFGRGLSARLASIKMTALYWHFVDVVWIFLFPALYLVGR